MNLRAAKSSLSALAVLHLNCHQVIMTAPPGSTLALFANPEFIAANGGVSVISALVTEPAGTPVPDGTVVQFFTNLGRIDEQGRTNDGVARVNLVSDSRSGTATVRAFSGGPATAPAPAASASPGASPPPTTGGGSGTSGTVVVTIGSALPNLVLVTAFPSRVIGDPRTSTIRAFVVDGSGNAVVGVPVLFVLSQGAAPAPSPSASPGASPSPAPSPAGVDFLTSRGQPVFTDNNGVAEDVLIVRTPPDASQRTVTITATTSNNKTGSTSVVIN